MGFVDAHLIGLPDVVFYFALLFPPFMMFRALGLLVRARGDELGYGGAESFLVPVLGEALPGVELGVDAPALAQHEQALVHDEQALLPAQPLLRAPLPAEIELPDELVSEPLPQVLGRKITSGDLAGAVRVLEQGGEEIPARTLSAQAWVELSKSCLAANRAPLALLALLRAVEVAPEGPLAPQAFLQAARIADEQQGDRARSNELLGELLRLHPATAEARFAQKRLGRSAP